MHQEAIDQPRITVKPVIDPATGLPSLDFAGAVQAPMPVEQFRRLAWAMLDMTKDLPIDMARLAGERKLP